MAAVSIGLVAFALAFGPAGQLPERVLNDDDVKEMT